MYMWHIHAVQPASTHTNPFVAEKGTVASVRVIFAYARVAGTRAAGVNSASLQNLQSRAQAGTLCHYGTLSRSGPPGTDKPTWL